MTFNKRFAFLACRENPGSDGGKWYAFSFFDFDDQETVEINAGGNNPELTYQIAEVSQLAAGNFGLLCDVSVRLRRDPQKGLKMSVVGISPVSSK